jgi:hypothetical protein
MSNAQDADQPAQLPEILDNPDVWVAEHIREYVATDGATGSAAGRRAPSCS